MSNIERRFTPSEVRVANSGRQISGYAAKFNKLSQDLGGFKERLAQGAFSRTINEKQDVLGLINHDPSKLIGRVASGTLRLAQDSVGLRFSCDVPKTSYGNDLLENVRVGNMSQCSFSFRSLQDDWENGVDDDGENCRIRTLRDLSCADISVVAAPAYLDTSVSTDDDVPRSLLFPDGLPAEIRSHLVGLRDIPRNINRERLNRVLSQ